MKMALSFVGGIAVGIFLSLLIAPDKGSETRKKLTESGSDRIDRLDRLKKLFEREGKNEKVGEKATFGQPSYPTT